MDRCVAVKMLNPALSMNERFIAIDQRVRKLLAMWAVPLLRVSLGIVFLWFGALKVLDVTPDTDLVAETVYWVDPDWFVPLLGWVEVAVGAALIIRRGLRLVLPVFLAQLVGTFLVLVVQPDVAFQEGNLFKLTVEGEFVVKNLVLLSAGLVVGATVEDERLPVGSGEKVRIS